MKTTKVYKKAFNRGNARIWIEGNILNSHKLTNGMRFKKERIDDDELLLSFATSFPEGIKSNKIAGNIDRPIIDLTGKWLSDFFGDAEKYTCYFDSETKTITIIRGGLV